MDKNFLDCVFLYFGSGLGSSKLRRSDNGGVASAWLVSTVWLAQVSTDVFSGRNENRGAGERLQALYFFIIGGVLHP